MATSMNKTKRPNPAHLLSTKSVPSGNFALGSVSSRMGLFHFLRYLRKYLTFILDEIAKSRLKDWIPACAGMTSIVSN